MSEEKKPHPMIPVPEAIKIVLRETGRVMLDQRSRGIHQSESISSTAPWSKILNTVLDKDVLMTEPGYPPYNASIMDGYCVRSSEFKITDQVDGNGFTHHVADNVYAGDHPTAAEGSPSESPTLPAAYYITTGAVVPDTFDCVVPIEECRVSDDKQFVQVLNSATIQGGKWIRPIGCDISANSVVLPQGHCMDPVALGLLKQSGAESIEVKKRVKVGVLSTGNELILGFNADPSHTGKIPDVNRPILLSLLESFGNVECVDLGMERDDDVAAMAKRIDSATEICDVIITTGGISMGDTDIVENVLIDHFGGNLHFGRIHMKPGKPSTFVTIPKSGKTCLVFALPGNPVSGTVCTELLVKPCLDLLYDGIADGLSGSKDSLDSELDSVVRDAQVHPELLGILSHDIKLDSVRPEYHRVTIDGLENGSINVRSTGVQRSSRLMSLRDATGLLVLPVGNTTKPKALKGDRYPVLIMNNSSLFAQPQVKNSLHLFAKKQMKVAVVLVCKDSSFAQKLDSVCDRIKNSLSGSKSGHAVIVSKRVFDGDLKDLYSLCIDSNDADLIVVVCVTSPGSYLFNLDVSSMLSKRLRKVAGALALQARQGVASSNSQSAIFEAVVGYAPEKQGAMMSCLPEEGVDGGLSNIRGLLKHALNTARGKPHNHHHK
ncbi:unnamed protein product [Cylindrotheca closterium]|uniref:molybdopterin adenylyltransferase n=1 Tax=Cylindrotheca closterium TaxID=2856 RepID=A0AAD2CKA4_9STRA|nr:unnamed protein product [Cylindrotheca closterium]